MTTTGPSLIAADPKARNAKYSFEGITANLMRLGTLRLEEFLRSPSAEPAPSDTFLFPATNGIQPFYFDAPSSTEPQGDEKHSSHTSTPIFVLHQLCSQTFGSIEPLKYEIIEENGKDKKQCILTITRPNGAIRSYTTKAEFSRKSEARAAAAAVAVDMGALDFIKHGAPDQQLKKGLVLAPLDAPSTIKAKLPSEQANAYVRGIEQECAHWRAGRVRPHWVQLIDTKPGGNFGCALRIQLSLHSMRVYAVDMTFSSFEDAKNACAKEAMEEGVIDFIKYGNGQTQPAEPNHLNTDDDDAIVTVAATAGITLQGFFDSLPRPFPESVDGKTVAEINAPSWLNTLVQSARGGKLTLQFIWVVDHKYGLHGAVLRVARPGECKAFLVDPQFPKRADAKAAVCLVAMSQGIGNYIRGVGADLDSKIPLDDRRRANDTILPLITTEYSKIWPAKSPELFDYCKDKDAFGCTITVQLAPEPQAKQVKRWTVPPEYRTKADAKTAAILHAYANGAIEFLQFRGEPPPEGYVLILPPSKRLDTVDPGKKNKKRKNPEAAGEDGAPRDGKSDSKKRQKLELPVKAESHIPVIAGLPPRPAAAVLKDTPAPRRTPAPAKGAWTRLATPVSHEEDHPSIPLLRGRKAPQLRAGYPNGRDGFVLPELGDPGYTAHGYGSRADVPSPYFDPYKPPPPPFADEPSRADGYTYAAAPGRYAYPDNPYYVPYNTERNTSYSTARYPPNSYPPHGPDPDPNPYYVPLDPDPGRRDYYYSHAPQSYAPHEPDGDPYYEYRHRDQYPPQSYAAPGSRHEYGGYAHASPERVWEPGPYADGRGGQAHSGYGAYDAAHSRQAHSRWGSDGMQRASATPARETPELTSSGNTPGKAPPVAGNGSRSSIEVVQRSASESAQDRAAEAQADPTATQSGNYAVGVNSPPAKPQVGDETSVSHKTALIAQCSKAGLAPPHFHSSEESGADGSQQYKVWIIMGLERLELPTSFSSVEEGEERLSKKVLGRLRASAKK